MNKQKFFCKTGTKRNDDAEILISQLYPRLGVPSAVYLPASMSLKTQNDKVAVVSNDIRTDDTEVAYRLRRALCKSGESKNMQDASKYLSGTCIKQIATMSALDLASCNVDRHTGNFFFKKDETNKAEEIVTIDHGFASNTMVADKSWFKYYSHFGDGQLNSRKQVIETIKESELLGSVLEKDELSQTVGRGIDLIPEIAQEIKEETGYKIDDKFVSSLQRNFDKTAEELTQ